MDAVARLASAPPDRTAASRMISPRAVHDPRPRHVHPAVLAFLAAGGSLALLGCDPAPPDTTLDDFTVVTSIDVGLNPHQISFSDDGRTAWVATAGEDRITVVDAETFEAVGTIATPPTPLGVIPIPNGQDLAVTSFSDGGVFRFTRQGSRLGGDRLTGVGSSSLMGPLAGELYLLPVEQADSMYVFDAARFTFTAAYPTGARPFPASATSDARLAFIPSYADGKLTVVNLLGYEIVETVAAGDQPSGATGLSGNIDVAVVVWGEDRPAFVNNTESHDVLVVDLGTRTVIARVPVQGKPIAMQVHPSGEALRVASEGEHRLTLIRIPEDWCMDPRDRPEAITKKTQVGVMAMTHDGHLNSAV